MTTRCSHLLAAAFLLLTTVPEATADDPLGSGLANTLQTTVLKISQKQHRINFSSHPPGEVLQFIARKFRDGSGKFTIDASQLKLAPGTRVRIAEDGWTILEAASMVADQVGADLLIKPGRIILVPRAAVPNK